MTDRDGAVAPAKPPVGVGATPLIAQLLALGLVALGVLGLQDLLARTDLIAGRPWLDDVLARVDGLASSSAAVLAGAIASLVVGLVVLLAALRRRPRKTLELDARTGVWLRTRDLPRLLRGTVETVDGVVDVDVRASRRTLRVLATTVVRDERRREVAAELEARVAPTLDALQQAPRPRIRLKEGAS